MLPGVEGIFDWTPPGAAEPAITLNDRSGVSPWFKVIRITGLHSIGDAEDNRDPRIGGLGEITRPSQRRGKSCTFEGSIQAASLRELREARDTLAAAFSDLTREGRMDCVWAAGNVEFEDAPPVFFEARALLAEVVEEQGTKGWNRPFVIGLRLGDPRHFDEETELFEATITNTEIQQVFA